MENPNYVVPTALAGTNDNRAASTAFVTAAVAAGIGSIVVFPSGTIMLFQQTSAPTGWTKITTYNDVGLRIVSGTVGSVTSQTAFSTVFAQTATGAHTLTTSEIPSHSHSYNEATSTQLVSSGAEIAAFIANAGATTGTAGSGGSHTHPVTLNLNYVDLILASKN